MTVSTSGDCELAKTSSKNLDMEKKKLLKKADAEVDSHCCEELER